MEIERSDTHLHWTELQRESVLDAHVFTVVKSKRSATGGRSGDYYMMETPDWANVVAITETDDGESQFVMVRQFRHGSMQVSLEFPGGVIEPGEDPGEAVVRELEEETGYRSRSIRPIGHVNPNPALMGNRCYTYLALDCYPVKGQNLDPNEIIDVELVAVDKLVRGNRDNEFNHAMMHVALRFYERHLRS